MIDQKFLKSFSSPHLLFVVVHGAAVEEDDHLGGGDVGLGLAEGLEVGHAEVVGDLQREDGVPRRRRHRDVHGQGSGISSFFNFPAFSANFVMYFGWFVLKSGMTFQFGSVIWARRKRRGH